MDLRKVYGGTPHGTESRCDTCSYSRLIKGYAEKERIVYCDRLYDPVVIPFKVAECSDYADRRLPDLDYLEKNALIIEVRGKAAGFVPSERNNLPAQDDD
jgi:hypothetical protein